MTRELERQIFFPVSEETYWRELCLSLEYQEQFYREALGCVSMDVVQNEGDYARGVKRVLRFQKPIDAPLAVTKVFGSTVALEEHSTFDAERRTWSYRMVPAVMGDRLDIRGHIRLEAAAGGVTQFSRNTVNCRLFGIGGIVELFVNKSTLEGNEDKRTFTERYIRERGLR